MHINHRRKSKFRAKHHGKLDARPSRCRPWLIYSTKPMQRCSWQRRRARVRHLIAHERYELLQTRYPRDIYWNYW